MQDQRSKTSVAPADRRRHRRMTGLRLRVELQGAVYTTLDWSLSGFRIAGYTGHLRVGDRAPVRLCGSGDGGELDAYVIARVVRANREKGQLAVTYVALPNGALQTLKRIARSRPPRP